MIALWGRLSILMAPSSHRHYVRSLGLSLFLTHFFVSPLLLVGIFISPIRNYKMQSLKFKTLHCLQTRTHAHRRRARFSLNIRTHTHTNTHAHAYARLQIKHICMFLCMYFVLRSAPLSPPNSSLAFPTPLSHFPTLALFLSSLPSRRRRAVVFQTYCAARIFSTM